MNHFGNPLVTTMHSPSSLRESVKPRHRRRPNTTNTSNSSSSSSSTRITPNASFDSSNHNDLLHLPSLQSPPLSTIHRRSMSDHQQLLHPADPPPSTNHHHHHHRQRSYTADAAALTSSSPLPSCSSSYCTKHTLSSLQLPSQYALNTTNNFELSLQEELQDFDAMISLSHHSASTTESSSAATSGGEDRMSYSSSSRRRSIPPHKRAIQNNNNNNSSMDDAEYDDMMI